MQVSSAASSANVRMIPVADDIARWRQCAARTHAAAAWMSDDRCRLAMLDIAESYERMARLAEQRIARRATGRAPHASFRLAMLIGSSSAFAFLVIAWLR